MSFSIAEFLKTGWLLSIDSERILLGWGQLREFAEPPKLATGAPSGCVVYAPDFYLNDRNPWKISEHWALVSRAELRAKLKSNPGLAESSGATPDDELAFTWDEPAETGFAGIWGRIQEGFQNRGLLKAVPVIFATSRGDLSTVSRRLKLLQKLVTLPSQLMVYGLWNESEGLIGASPELLFRRSPDGWIQTVALAGTAGKDDPMAPLKLKQDPKERFEHQLVVDDLKSALVTIGDVEIGSTEVLELPSLYHLCTRVRVRPHQEIDFLSLVKRLHPTPALGVAPRALGFSEMKIWDESAETRARFGAPFGAYFEGGESCLVAIRNLQWQGDELRIGSGCGVVGESSFSREWNELKMKRESVKRMLGL
jgi:isochorismate synthase EntC